MPEGPDLRMRHALEVRHDSFRDDRFIQQLRRHGVALVIADSAGKFLHAEDITADFTYLRLHGDQELYVSGYSDEALDRWADRIRQWSSGTEPDDARRISASAPAPALQRDVYCYFDNDAKVHAPFDAMKLAKKLQG
jgi:uncharacterized protein YecE (DUF72 family)